MTEGSRDQWAEWLLERRFGSTAANADSRDRFMEPLWGVREAVLKHAQVAADEALLDVGCGDGLIGFGALDRGARVIFSDISRDLLQNCREAAARRGVEDRSQFVQASADDLSGIDDASVDIVTTRSVLIYVDDKARALAEFFRVLRPGGRISLYEPINTFALLEGWERRFWLYPANGLAALAEKVNAVYAATQPSTDPMFDFDERDLIRFSELAGFFPVELELQTEIKAADPQPLVVFLNSSGNPKIPTFAEAMEASLTPAERKRVIAHLRPLVEEGRGVWRMAHAYLWATKPQSESLTLRP